VCSSSWRPPRKILTGYAHELGVEIWRGQELTALHQDTDSVNVQVNGPHGHHQLRAGFVVGCDGGASVVRQQAGIDLPGIPSAFLLRLGDGTPAIRKSSPPGRTSSNRSK